MSDDPDKLLSRKHCLPCEGGVPKLDRAAAEALLRQVPEWRLSADAARIERRFRLADFAAVLALVNRIGALAEAENHHPDLHIERYRNLRVELSTHAIGGLSENDFILAAKIDDLSR